MFCCRDVLIKSQTASGCRFLGDGYVSLEAHGFVQANRGSIVFRFKTTSLDGLLFLEFVGQVFTVIELRGGYIYFKVCQLFKQNLKLKFKSLKSKSRRIHKVKFFWGEKKLIYSR